jgi:hypothetical protein
MNKEQKTAFIACVKTMLAFHKRGTPGGDEYARRMRQATAHLAKGQFDAARRWIMLCDVPEIQG